MTLIKTDYPAHFEPYIALAGTENAKTAVLHSLAYLEKSLNAIPETKVDYAYAPEKWTVKQVLQHCIDAERIFAYRALCHARGEQQILPGFDDKRYGATASLNHRTLESLISESILVRKASIALFESFTKDDLDRIGSTGAGPIKAKSWAYIIVGHWVHHLNILKERYGI